jgi:probable phosphoglycerate mutase
VKELAAKYEAQTIVLVGHTVINRAILLGVLGLGNERFWRLRQDTCAINVFEAEGGDYTLVSLNDTCHLRDWARYPNAHRGLSWNTQLHSKPIPLTFQKKPR